jgi:hypothetical protein
MGEKRTFISKKMTLVNIPELFLQDNHCLRDSPDLRKRDFL